MKKINLKGPIVSNDTGWLYEYFGMDCAYPNKLAKGLEEAAGDDVTIEINSGGGVCVYGYEMYKAVRDYGGRTTAHVISAMSAATLIACACDETLMSDAAIFMVHNSRSQAEGDYRDMHMEGRALEEFNDGIINVYMRKTGMGRDAIQELMDNDTYMGPEKAISLGFADGYIFGEPGRDGGDNPAGGIVAAGQQVIPEDKAVRLVRLIKGLGVEQKSDGGSAVDDTINKQEGGETKMTLDEFLAENPEAGAEIEQIKAQAREDGANTERDRIRSLDRIGTTVSAQMLDEAKYGDNPVDGPTLAYRAMVEGERLAQGYMKQAKADTDDSGAGMVGIGTPDTGGQGTDEADEMAAHVNNRRKGGR